MSRRSPGLVDRGRVAGGGAPSAAPRLGLLDPRRAVDHLLLAPAALIIAAVFAFPIAYSFFLSTRQINLIQSADDHPFIGLGNYLAAATDVQLLSAIRITGVFAAGTVAGSVTLGLALALLLNDESIRGQRLCRTLLLVPWAISPLANGMMWSWIYQGRYGVLNAILLQLGITREYVNFFIDPGSSMAALIFAEVWKAVPFVALTLLAGLQGVRRELYEAASIDGAGALGRFRHVTLPGLRNILLVVVVLQTVWEVQAFGIIYVLTGGGPGLSTTTANLYIYNIGFKQLQLGYAAALSHLLTLAILGFTVIYLRIFGSSDTD